MTRIIGECMCKKKQNMCSMKVICGVQEVRIENYTGVKSIRILVDNIDETNLLSLLSNLLA